MHNRAAQDLRSGPPTIVLYPKYQTILEREYMEFRPFGLNDRGEKISDISGVVVQSNVDYLCDYLSRTVGPNAAGRRLVA